MANEQIEPFILDFQNGQQVEDILKKAQNLANIKTVGAGLQLNNEAGELTASGSSGAPFIVNMTYSNGSYSVDKTVPEIFDAVQNNRNNIIVVADDPQNSNMKYVGKNLAVCYANEFADKYSAYLAFSTAPPITDSLSFKIMTFTISASDVEGYEIYANCRIGIVSVESGLTTITPEMY